MEFASGEKDGPAQFLTSGRFVTQDSQSPLQQAGALLLPVHQKERVYPADSVLYISFLPRHAADFGCRLTQAPLHSQDAAQPIPSSEEKAKIAKLELKLRECPRFSTLSFPSQS